VLLLTLIGGTIFLDVIGAINLTRVIPKNSSMIKLPYISNYLDYSYHQHLSEEDRIKETMNKYREILEGRRQELELRENKVEAKETELKSKEEQLVTLENSLMDKEEELKKKEETISKLYDEYNASAKNIEKFALIYTSMAPESVAKIIVDADLTTVAKIFELMENKKIAAILDALAVNNPEKVMELVDLMTAKKGN
jgi:flagellar motility protein MotE (MotC chaperone)